MAGEAGLRAHQSDADEMETQVSRGLRGGPGLTWALLGVVDFPSFGLAGKEGPARPGEGQGWC